MLIVTFNDFPPTRLFSTTCLLIFAKLSLLHGYLALHVYLEHKSNHILIVENHFWSDLVYLRHAQLVLKMKYLLSLKRLYKICVTDIKN